MQITKEFESECRRELDAALKTLGKSSIIPTISLTDGLRRGLYLAMKAYGLGMRQCSRADWEWVEICEDDKSPALSGIAIKSRDFDDDKFLAACESLTEIGRERPREIENQKDEWTREDLFGWLSPQGRFTPSPFGSHDDAADKIISGKNWADEFYDCLDIDKNIRNGRDFLIMKKRYVLLHNPSGSSFEPFVTRDESIPLTKAQREFLYDFYKKLGNSLKADSFMSG